MVDVIKAEVEAGAFASTSEAIRADVQASLGDSRLDLTGDEVDAWLETLDEPRCAAARITKSSCVAEANPPMP